MPHFHMSKTLFCLALLPALSPAKSVKCKTGKVAFETMTINGKEVDVLTTASDCPHEVPEGMPLPAVAIASETPQTHEETAALVKDSPRGALASASASVATSSASEAPAAAGQATLLPCLVMVLFVLLVAGGFAGGRLYDQKVRQPRLLSEAEARRQAEESESLRKAEEGARLAAELEEQRAAQEEAERRAREEAERLAKEELERIEREKSEQRREREEAARVATEKKEAEETRAKEAAAEERRRRELQEADERAKAKKEAEEAAKKGCCGCGAKPKVGEPGAAGRPQQ